MTAAALPDLDNINRLPLPPAVVLRLLRSFDDQDVSTAEIAHAIGLDPALSLRVLGVVNSPFYGLPRQIGGLSEAVMVLGFGTVRNLVIGASLISSTTGPSEGLACRREVWEHSLYCALVSQRLARPASVDADWAFTAGLLHDIGKVALYSSEPDYYRQVCAHRTSAGLTFVEAERALLGLDHCEVGGRVLARWRLPAAIERVATHHHGEADAGDPLLALVRVADRLAHAAAAGTLRQEIAQVGSMPDALRLHLEAGQCTGALEQLADDFDGMRALLNQLS